MRLPQPFLEAEAVSATSAAALSATDDFLELLQQSPGPSWASLETRSPPTVGRLRSDGPSYIAPFVRAARGRLALALDSGGAGTAGIAHHAVAVSLARSLVEELELLLFRPLLLEGRIALLERPDDADAVLRFRRRLRSGAGKQRLFNLYPGLLRQMHLRCDRWVAACAESLGRLAVDRPTIERTFGIAASDHLVDAAMAEGDPHAGGRKVVLMRFETGARLAYKPRPMRAARCFQDLIAFLNGCGLSIPLRSSQVLDRGSYGWMEYIYAGACRSDAGVRRFYRRCGSLLAALHVAGATDCHFENILAAGEHPVTLDLETLMRPALRTSGNGATDAARFAIEDSILAVGLLPSIDGIGLGALAVAPMQATGLMTIGIVDAGTPNVRVETMPWHLGDVTSLPLQDGRRIGAEAFVSEIDAGFAEAYNLLATARGRLLPPGGIIEQMAASTIRVVLRPTAFYSELLRDLHHPSALHDAVAGDCVASRLWNAGDDVLRKAARSELEQLRRADIPYFTMRGSGRRLNLDAARPNVSHCAIRSGAAVARARLRRMGPRDLARQRSFLGAAMGGGTFAAPRSVAPHGVLAAAAAVGDRLLAQAITAGGGMSWLRLDDVGTRSLMPVDPWLYDGTLGIALFLAGLQKATRDRRYGRASQLAVYEASRQSEARGADVGGSLFEGAGGLLYASAHLSDLTENTALLPLAEVAAARLASTVGHPPATDDLVGGTAGLTLAVLALNSVMPSAAAGRLLAACRTRLLGIAQAREAVRLPFDRGASHGWSGILLALARLEAHRPDEAVATALQSAVTREADLAILEGWTDPGDDIHAGQASWCHGAPGIALCRIAAWQASPSDRLRTSAEAALRAFDAPGLVDSPEAGLCHGFMGVIDILVSARRAGFVTRSDPEALARAWIASDNASGPKYDFSPGLMTGLAGIGHALLRLHDCETPCFLALDPPAPGMPHPSNRLAASGGR